MSVGYVLLTVAFLTVAFVVCLLVYRYYTRVSIKAIPWACAVWHVIALYMCTMSFPLLIVDVDATLAAQATHASGETWMKSIWITIFAVTYFCAWVSLPLAQLYTEVGEFTWQGAVLHSLKLNLKLYAIIIVVIVVVFVYLLILKGAYDSRANVLKVGISLANAWGLLMLILFMPAGLVGVPRMLWRYADAQRLLRRTLYEATDIQEDLDLAAADLAAVKAELIKIDPLVSDAHRVYLTRMLEAISRVDREVPLYHVAAQRVKIMPATAQQDISLPHLEDLHARLKHSIKIVNRANYRWNTTVRHCDRLDAMTRPAAATDGALRRGWIAVRRYVYWIACGASTLLTVLILWSELVLPFRGLVNHPLGVIELLMNSRAHFIVSIVLLFYMAYCAYWAAFQFKVFDIYVIYPDIADNASLCFNEVFLVRLLMPLCFNFLLISGLSQTDIGQDVMYGQVYRTNMDVSLLFGSWFNRFLPMLIPFISAIVFFNLAQRVLSVVGVEVHNPNAIDDPAVQQRIADGRRLVEHELGHPITSGFLPGEEELRRTSGGGSRAVSPRYSGAGGADGGNGSAAGTPQRGRRYREYLERKRSAAQSAREGELMNSAEV